MPDAPVLSVLRPETILEFSGEPGTIEVGSSTDPLASEPSAWHADGELVIPQGAAELTVFARRRGAPCRFRHTYQIRDAFPGPPGSPDSTAVTLDDARIAGWATAFEGPVAWGTDVDAPWKQPEEALGPAEGTSLDVVSLGNGGVITLRFDPALSDGPGPDLAVFENGVSDGFLELARVEVSSDGQHFAEFDCAYAGEEPVPAFGLQEPELFDGLAGKYRQGFGTPFDLSHLRFRPVVTDGSVDLSAITHVRIIDVVGDGNELDSFGHAIYDPHPTVGSGGFDLDGVAALHVAE